MYNSECKLEVRYYETDSMAIVHHSNYIRYFEYGRSVMMKELGMPIELLEANGIMLPVVSLDINYQSPSKMGDILTIKTQFVNWPRVKILIAHQIYNQKGELICRGNVNLCFLDSNTRKPVRAPQIVLDKLESYFTEDEKNR